MKLIKNLGQDWNNFWFEPVPADNLGLCRIILYGFVFLFYVLTPILFKSWGWHQDFTLWGQVSNAFWFPVWLFAKLHFPQLSTGPLILVQSIWQVSLLLSCVGLFSRFSTAVSFIFGVYLFGLPNSFGKIHHLEQVLVWAFMVMAFSRCGDAWSLDALIRKSRTSPPEKEPIRSGEYTWPVHLIWVISAVLYLEAGLSKLRHSGLRWVTGATMQNSLLRAFYHGTDAEPLTRWGLFFAQSHWLSSALAAGSLVFELGLVVAIFSPKSRWILIPGVIIMQTGIAFLMGPNFYQLIACQAIWVPWDKVIARVVARFHREGYGVSSASSAVCGSPSQAGYLPRR